jgi:hypothetical protein
VKRERLIMRKKDFFAYNLKYLHKKNNLSQKNLTYKLNKLKDDEEKDIHYTTIGRYKNILTEGLK